MSHEIATLENEIKEYKVQLETVQLGLQADPESLELQELKTELEQVISLTEATIAELKPVSVSTVVAKNQTPAKEKWSRENHPAFKKSATILEEEAPSSFKVNDTVLAKWHTGDKGFYPARITSITGSSTAPVYIVKFRSYNATETLREKDIKPIVNSNKRKADGTPAAAPNYPTPSLPSNVIVAAADINPELAQKTKREPSKVSDGPVRPAKVPKKFKANKELEAGKSKWQEFATKGKFGKTAKKESMFRTPEGVHGRVGFTGSGQSMRKDQTRTRHIYNMNGDDEG
ncbi:Splicing factor spf30 [Golovinomyces cichoracearum]|uniref:Splicing factor spf30 n=1 Tax=Golovinomyces cichoracearum TaxID=62708 RepID=A0A420IY74_9PEZI|nr:Splicing factor spf30 [Golovinomyces cichoracearum]